MRRDLDPPCQFPAGEQHPAAALTAFKANIRSQADNHPFITAAGMRFAQAHALMKGKVGQHGNIITHVIILSIRLNLTHPAYV